MVIKYTKKTAGGAAITGRVTVYPMTDGSYDRVRTIKGRVTYVLAQKKEGGAVYLSGSSSLQLRRGVVDAQIAVALFHMGAIDLSVLHDFSRYLTLSTTNEYLYVIGQADKLLASIGREPLTVTERRALFVRHSGYSQPVLNFIQETPTLHFEGYAEYIASVKGGEHVE